MMLIIPSLIGIAYGHTVDSVGEYRVEIGWMNEPVVSGETNAIEFYVSPLVPCPEIEKAIKCAESQDFQNGVVDLKKTIKMQLVFKDEKITLPLSPDHNIPGKYYAFVNPTVSGFYQANILGAIKDTPISLSMHPPKVAERAYIEFPKKEHEEIIEQHNTIQSKHDELEAGLNTMQSQYNNLESKIDSVEKKLEQEQQSDGFSDFDYAGIAIAVTALALGVFAVRKNR